MQRFDDLMDWYDFIAWLETEGPGRPATDHNLAMNLTYRSLNPLDEEGVNIV